jgi:hypothetical protein
MCEMEHVAAAQPFFAVHNVIESWASMAAFEEYGKMRMIQTRFAPGIWLSPFADYDIQPRSHVFYVSADNEFTGILRIRNPLRSWSGFSSPRG